MKTVVTVLKRTGAECTGGMPAARAERLKEITNADMRGQYIAATEALKGALLRLTGSDAAAMSFSYAPNGAPRAEGAYVSLSHTEGMAACAASDVPVGIDIERADRAMPERLRERFGDTDEWLALEACVKLTEEGLSGIKKYRREGDVMLDDEGNAAGYVRYLTYGEFRIAVCCRERFETEITE